MILDEILASKESEVAAARAARPLEAVKAAAAAAPAPRSFFQALQQPSRIQVIAEVKKASPSKGVIREDFDPVAIARAYEKAGAACISVLTDATYFQGSLDYLTAVREAVSLPVLRKDFIIDEYQVYEARAAGADCILLIVSAFFRTSDGRRTTSDLNRLARLAQSLGMDVLAEIHDGNEFAVALQTGAKVVGINNRDLRTFETSLEVTFKLMPKIPRLRLMVSESGIRTPDDLKRLEDAGIKAVLVGESLMREADPGAALLKLRSI